MRKIVSLLTLLVLYSSFTMAQLRVITGKVLDEKGEPVPFASVKVKNATGGVAADANGDFKIQASPGAVLVISTVGGNSKEVTVTNDNIYNITLQKQSAELSTVVVSAFGLARSVKSTPFATQQVSGDRLTITRDPDLTSALSGKISGLQVLGQSGSKLGSAGTVRLRGVSGFADRGAIYVVDGTIVQNVNDINMDDVASVSVLKGPNATALYGQRAEGGVILITTKKIGRNKPLGVEFNTTTTFDKVNILPEYQNIYGGGASDDPNQAWAENAYAWKATDPVEWKQLQGYRRPQYFDDASWGPKFDGGDYIPWYAWYGGHSLSNKTAKWVPQEDNIRDFYQTGISANNNISISKSGDAWKARLSYTNLAKKGVVPNANQIKHYFSTQNSFDLGSHFTLASNVGVTFEDFKGDFYDEYSNNTTGSFSQWFHRDLDMGIMKSLRGLKTPGGTYASWNIDDQGGISTAAIQQPLFWYNSYTWLDNLDNKTKRTRVLGDVSLVYRLNSNFKVTGAYRLNYRTTNQETRIPYILEASAGTSGYTADELGNTIYSKFRKADSRYRESNFELIGQFNKKFNNVTVDFIAGGNVLDIKRDDSARTTNGGLKVPDVYAISNSKSPAGLAALLSYRQVQSAFFRGTIGYKDFLFVDFSGRNDWSSTLPTIKNSYFYPSVGASFVFSDFMKNTALSFGKFRLSAAQVGTDPLNPYNLQFLFTTGNIPFGADSLTAVPDVFIDPKIEAPLNTSFEAGVDLRFMKDRVGFSATVYHEKRQNEIVTTEVSATSGFLSGTINAGEVVRKGLELELNLKPVVTRDFTWDFTTNWATNVSTVNKVSSSTDLFTIYSNYVGQPVVVGTTGQQWGQMQATGIKKLDGIPVVDPATGLYEFADNTSFGSVLPLYNGGFYNSFNYKGFILTASIDFQRGGKYFSFSDFNGKYSGLNKETAATNDRGVNVREPVSSGGGVHVYGVTSEGKAYDAYVNGYDYFHQFNNNSIWDYSIFDATYMKLREVSLGYGIPVKKLGNISKTVKSAYLSFVARNLLMIYSKNRNIDPTEIAAVYAENGQLPGTKSLGINLKIVF